MGKVIKFEIEDIGSHITIRVVGDPICNSVTFLSYDLDEEEKAKVIKGVKKFLRIQFRKEQEELK